MSVDWSWNRLMHWTDAALGGTSLTMSADEGVRARIAEGLDVEGIASLAADLKIVPWLDGMEVSGIVHAVVTRTCGVSLELFEEMVDEPFVLRFVPENSPNASPAVDGDVELDLEADDPPDGVAGDTVDLGSYLAEQLALALTPFPKKPGVTFQPPANSGLNSPFAVLSRLKSTSTDAGE